MSNPNVVIDRHKYVGGSDLPTILGLNAKYGTNIFEFAKQKAGIVPNVFKGNQFTKYGQKMEPVIRDYINSLYNANYIEDTTINNNLGYRGNTDGIDINADIPILEIKTFGEELDVEYYTPQCQFYMETFNQDSCLLVGYKRPSDFYRGVDYDIENDDNYFNLEFDPNNIVKHVINRDKKLWKKIENRINAFKYVVEELRKNPNMNETEFNKLYYGEDLLTMTHTLEILEKSLSDFKDIEKEYKTLKEKLYNLFEEKNIISFDTGTIKITKVDSTSYETVSIDTKSLQVEEPDIYDKYKITKTTNRKGYILITNRKVGSE